MNIKLYKKSSKSMNKTIQNFSNKFNHINTPFMNLNTKQLNINPNKHKKMKISTIYNLKSVKLPNKTVD